MIKVAKATNSFLPVEQQADTVPHSKEEPVFTLTYGQLQELITQAIGKAIQPLQDRISSLEDRIGCFEKENAALGIKMVSLENMEEQDVTRICLDIAQDRQRISKLERVEPQPMQKDRGEILRALLVANGGKMLAKDARSLLHLSKNRFSELLKTCNFIEKKSYHLDRRQYIIILKSELVPRN